MESLLLVGPLAGGALATSPAGNERTSRPCAGGWPCCCRRPRLPAPKGSWRRRKHPRLWWAAARLADRALPHRLMHEFPWHALACGGWRCWDRGARDLLLALRQDGRFRAAAAVPVIAAGCLGRRGDGPICWLEPAGTCRIRVETGKRDKLLATLIRREGAA